MRISEVEIYTSKQIDAFIEYLKVLSVEKKAIEDMQSHYSNVGMLAQGNSIGLGAATQATPEYMANLHSQAIAEKQAAECEKAEG